MAIGSRSSAIELRPPWARWLMPSASDAIFVALLAVLMMSTVSVRLLGDAGIGWHIRTGQFIVSARAIPRVDPFSSSMSGHPWFAWEWLYDLIVGGLENAAGLNGVIAFTGFIIALTFAWTFRLLLRREVNLFLSLVLVLLAASASMIHFLARPHVLTWLFTVAWFWALDSTEHGSSENWKLWLLPLTMLLWVNLHGGFLVGFVLLAIYWVGAAWQFFTLNEGRFDDALAKIRAARSIRSLTVIGVLSAAATFVNPYGLQLHIHIYRYLSNRFLMDHIDEFQSPNFHYVAQKCFAGLLLLSLLALATRRREVSVTHGLVLLFAVYSGLYASRNIPVSSLLIVLVIGPWLSDAIEKYAASRGRKIPAPRQPPLPSFLERMSAIELSLCGHLWPIAATLLIVWMAAHNGKIGVTTLMDAHFNPRRFPVKAVDYLEAHNLPGPIMSTDSWGGYLIYRLYPRVCTVLDDRHDFYGEKFFESYLKMVRVEPGWQDFLQQHHASSVIVPKNSALANMLDESRGWRPIYGDDTAVVFALNDSAPQPRSEPMLQNPSH
jgi:hypothetical protein